MSAKKASPSKTQHVQLQQQIDDLKDKLARALADYANLEKRIDGQRQLFVALSTTAIITKMIEVLDDLHLAQNHLKNPGLQITINKLVSALRDEGLTEVEAQNHTFNPETMDCVEVAIGPQDQVVQVKKRGYLFNGRCLRPAQVVVGKNSEIKN